MKLKHPIFLVLTLLLSFACLLVTTGSNGQGLKYETAKNYEKTYDFETAAEIYEDILEKRPADLRAIRAAGSCYEKLTNYVRAEELYELAARMENPDPRDLLRYAEMLKHNGKFDLALATFSAYRDTVKNNAYVNGYFKVNDWFHRHVRDSARYLVYDSNINSTDSDFGPCFIDGAIIFSSARAQGKGKKHIYDWTNQSYLNLFIADINADSTLGDVRVMDDHANSRLHEGTVALDAEHDKLYLTRNQYLDGVKTHDENGNLRLGIYEGNFMHGVLGELRPFEYNDPNFSVGHPSINTTGDVMFFVSDDPSGLGGTDLYMCTRDKDSWSKPVNMGAGINTPKNEMFPFIGSDNVLYFASDGYPNLGGLDVFSIDLSKEPLVVVNLGYPINSAYDDFGFVQFPNGKGGYFSSNRPGGSGGDDILEFVKKEMLSINLSGQVLAEDSGIPIDGAQVQVYLQDELDAKPLETYADDQGRYIIDVPYQYNYLITASQIGFVTGTRSAQPSERSGFIEHVDFKLERSEHFAKGRVKDAKTGDLIENALVILYDKNHEMVDRAFTNEKGKYLFTLSPNQRYFIEVQKDPYPSQEIEVLTTNLNETVIRADFDLFMLETGTVVRIDNIYYDYNKATLRPEAKIGLNRLKKLLFDNPELRIELSSHTDSRGRSTYNQDLSQRRAQSVVDYLIEEGVEPSRLEAKGYGESRLLNRCKDGVKCSEEEHQVNRRTEFTIL